MFCQAGEKAVSCGVTNVSSIDELSFIKALHRRQEIAEFSSCYSMYSEHSKSYVKCVLTRYLFIYSFQDRGRAWNRQVYY